MVDLKVNKKAWCAVLSLLLFGWLLFVVVIAFRAMLCVLVGFACFCLFVVRLFC